MLSYALDVWRMSWITAASKAQSGLLAVPEDTSLQKRERGGKKIFIKFSSHWQAACFSSIWPCVSMWSFENLQTAPPSSPPPHFQCCPVSKVITGRLLCAFMKYSNGSMSYCALIMPDKDKKKKGGGGQMARQKTIMSYWDVSKNQFVFFSSLKKSPFTHVLPSLFTNKKITL